jgi:hypothetical protein
MVWVVLEVICRFDKLLVAARRQGPGQKRFIVIIHFPVGNIGRITKSLNPSFGQTGKQPNVLKAHGHVLIRVTGKIVAASLD